MKNIWLPIILLISVVVLIFSDFGTNEGRVYDCSLSEISPDFPQKVKEECRRLRYEQWKYEREEYDRKRMIRA